ncbi:30S ribosomal protein S17e [Candidatus Bathyarchaeota archaeon]|nr:MAG: 30S ribosomal protein S17e [Candidatus Bathyarchaeota archaeon]
MGCVKTTLIKRISKQLLEKYPDMFTDNFEENKKIVSKLLVVDSKKIKDQVAGHITRLKKIYS